MANFLFAPDLATLLKDGWMVYDRHGVAYVMRRQNPKTQEWETGTFAPMRNRRDGAASA